MTVVAVLMACQEKESITPMQIEVGSQVEVVGICANNVKPDTVSLVIVRDSVTDEKTDTIFNLKTSATLILDSTFVADKMEETMQLQINDVTFVPADSALANNLITFLKSEPGTKTVIEFVCKAEKSKYLQLQNATKASITGFSFHKLDPEALADPKITSLIDKFEKLAKEIGEDIREYGDFGIGAARAEEIGSMRNKLNGMKSKMSPKQLERFQYVMSNYQTSF